MKRIALTTLSGGGYGGKTYFTNLIPALLKQGLSLEYHIYSERGSPLLTTIRAARVDNVVIHECIGKGQAGAKRFLFEQCVLPLLLWRHHIDVIFTAKNMTIFFAPCATIIAIRNAEPFRYRQYTNAWILNGQSWLKWQLTRLSIRRAKRIVAVSDFVRSLVGECCPTMLAKTVVVYNGNPVPTRACDAPALPQGTPLHFLLTASKFVAYANQHSLIDGYAVLKRRRPDIPPLLMAGGVHDRHYADRVFARIRALGLEHVIIHLGLIPHDLLLAYMARARAFLFPSTLEACPHTLIEAMASRAAIATSNVPPMPEICRDAALYFDPHNPAMIADILERIIWDDAKRAQLQQRAVARAAQFTWERTARAMVALFTTA